MDKFAILGGGPSAFYVASRLLSRVPKDSRRKLVVHMYDRLWAPHGLVRYGVAPDHPEVKNCTHKFDEIAMDARFRYFGNVQVGHTLGHPIPHAVQLPLQDIQQNYTHLVLASGCPVPAIHPTLPPSSRVIPALDMVHWYTQHPTQALIPPLESTQHVTVIGQGNVALDVARMLLTNPDVLGAYDVPSPVLHALRASTVRHVSIVGRRGPLQAAFTTKELRELMNIPDASMVPLDPALLQPPEGFKPSRQQSRVFDLLRKGSTSAAGSTRKTWSLNFFRAPVGVKEASGSGNKLTVELARTVLDTDARAIPTGETDTVGTDLVVAALGQKLDPSTPFYDPVTRRIPVDATGNVLTPAGTPYANVFASGWAAMGAHGVLASTMMNAYNVADNIAARLCGELGGIESAERVMREDIAADDDAPPQMVREEAQVGNVVSYEDWKIIDAEEVRRGEEMGKERERMVWKEAKELLSATRA